ncbi:MAG: hypothetical protein OXT65_11080, partial [Alphaproteobacteria bacterium]|nr:hypothetical protein [Alphaproteobacteria bacterium]
MAYKLNDLTRDIQDGNLSAVKDAVQKHPHLLNPDEEYATCMPLTVAAAHSQADILDFLLKRGANPEEQYPKSFYKTVAVSDPRIIGISTQRGKNLNLIRLDNGNTMLHYAAERGKMPAVKELLFRGVDPAV